MEVIINVKSNINLVEVHPQLGNNNHIVDWCSCGCRFSMAFFNHFKQLNHCFVTKCQGVLASYI